MARHHVAGVEIDTCSQHGTWFDSGELQRVARALAARSAYGARSGQAAATTGMNRGMLAAGAVAGGAVAVGAVAAGAAIASNPEQVEKAQRQLEASGSDLSEVAIDAVEIAAEVVDPGAVIDGAAVVAEVGGGLLSGAFELIGGLLSGL